MNENKMMIPQIIHYVWVGKNQKPEIVLQCIESWKKYLPDYEIREWNEDNYDVLKNEYIREAYIQKKWAFVSDFIRFDLLNEYGGIYIDTDVEFLKRIPKKILSEEAFTGVESSGMINPGLIFGCPPNYWISRKMVDSYKSDTFDIDHIKTVNVRMTDILREYGFQTLDIYQVINGLAIYPSSYFCGYDLDIHDFDIKENTISVHHYAGTWKKRSKKTIIQKKMVKIIGKKNYKKLLKIKRMLFGIRTN